MSIIVSQLITDALLQATVIGIDQQLDDARSSIGLRRLQRMIDSWANVRDLIFATTQESFTMTANQASYSTTLLTSGRPVSVDSMWVSLNSIDYPVQMRSEQWYNAITYKPTAAVPDNCYYDPSMPNGAFYFYPVPYAAFTCYVVRCDALTGALTMNTVLTMPKGYEKALVDCLAVDVFPSMKGSAKPIPADLRAAGNEAKRVLKVTNYVALEMSTPFDSNDGNFSNAFLYKAF